MTDYLNIGPTPAEEKCAQVGIDPNYDSASKRECTVYQRMLERLFPIPDTCCAYFFIKSFPHDFGSYREVCVRFDSDDEESSRFAIHVERESPGSWDQIAISEMDWYKQREGWWAKVTAGTVSEEKVPPEFQAGFPPEPSNEAIAACCVRPIGILRRRILQGAQASAPRDDAPENPT